MTVLKSRWKLSIFIIAALLTASALEYPSVPNLESWLSSTLNRGHGSTNPTSNSTIILFKHFRLTIARVTPTPYGNATIYNANFLPDEITVNARDNLMINVTNNDGTTHGFTVQGLSSPETILAGETVSVTLQNVQTGTYSYFCQLHPNTHYRGGIYVS